MRYLLAILVLCGMMLLPCGTARTQDAAPAPKLTYPGVRVMIVVPEAHIGRQISDPAAETELIRMFAKARYTVIDQTQYAAMRYTPEMEEVVKNPTGLKARALTTKYGADLLIVGEAFSQRAELQSPGAISCRARVEVRAVFTQAAQIIAATDGIATGADVTEFIAAKIGLRKAGNVAGQYLLQEIGDYVDGPTAVPGEETSRPNGQPTIAVAPFDDRSQWSLGNWNLGQQIPDLITVELMKLGSVAVIDRASIEQVKKLQREYISGMYDNAGQAMELGTLAQADYLIVGRISEFATKRTGLLGGRIGLGMEKAVVRILIKVIDVKRGTVLAASEAKGEATEAVLGGGYVGVVFGGAVFDKSAVGRATRKAIAGAIELIEHKLPGVTATNDDACPHCKARVGATDKFCAKCGKKIDRAPADCPKCRKPVTQDDNYCRNCGTRLKKSDD
jgi:curli biogenesis system outer membrane secretion channel CsgG